MFYRFLLTSLLSLTAITTVQARGLDLSLGNDAAQITYLFDSNGQIGIGGTDMGIGLLFNDNDDLVFNGSILVTGNSLGRNRALQLGAGVKAYLGTLDVPGDEDSVFAVAIGGKMAYILPSRTPLSISLEAYIAPAVTSFGDSDGVTELLLRFEAEIAPTTRFFIGYRDLEAEFDGGPDYEIDDSMHLGVRFSF